MASHLDDELQWLNFSPVLQCQISPEPDIFEMTICGHGSVPLSPLVERRDETVSPGETVYTPNSLNNEHGYQLTGRTETAIERDFPLLDSLSAPHTSAWTSCHSSPTPVRQHEHNATMEDFDEQMNDLDFPYSTQSSVSENPQQLYQDQQQFYQAQPSYNAAHAQLQPQYIHVHGDQHLQQSYPQQSTWQQAQSFPGFYSAPSMYGTQYEGMPPTLQAQHLMSQPAHIKQQHSPLPVRTLPQKQLLPRNAIPGSSASQPKQKKGGRKPQSKLPEQTRQQASNTRKYGACWRCAFQRDNCSPGPPGQPCGRCKKAHESGTLAYLPCDRSKLPDFLQDFLPASITYTYQKQIIMDCVANEVAGWVDDNTIDVRLSTGWGVDIHWTLVEFIPRHEEMLTQSQYFQNEETRLMEQVVKYSPPFGIKKLESVDKYFDAYMAELFQGGQHLQDFSEMCYASESRFETFPEDLLNSLCNLVGTQNDALKEVLEMVITMMILTYVMTHTLTIVPETLSYVIGRVTGTPVQMGAESQKHTSPRLANRQLKFYFSTMRERIYVKLLKWCQRTLHASGAKDNTWLPVFCAMLGFAMVLEEIQCNLQIQAHAKWAKQEKTWESAQSEARFACERIDERFDLMCRLFRYKYRSDSWTKGTFAARTPNITDPAEFQFLHRLRRMMETKAAYLRERRDVPLGDRYQCMYTSRLVAKFLLPFLEEREHSQ